MSLGQTVARIRKAKGWTQVQLAEKLEMATAHVNRIERDRTQPRTKTLDKLSEVFQVSREELVPESTPHQHLVADPELSSLLSQVSVLDSEQLQALRTFLRSMIACQQIQQISRRAVSSASFAEAS